jgi:ABC-type nitrate/sulfonate/bicarbonate transport system substrate-binding protein
MDGRWNLTKWGVSGVLACALHTPLQSFAAEAPNLRIVYNALGGSMAPVWVAHELGLFAKHGLQHNLNYLAATTAVQAMVAGSEEIGLVGNQAVDVALEGADTVYVGSMPALVSMLKSGNAAAGLISAPTTFQAQELGLKPIVSVTDLNIPFIFVGVATTRKVIQQKPDAITRFLRAYTESIAIIRSDKETALKALGKFLKTHNRRALEGIYEEYGNAFQRLPLMTKEAVQAVLDVAKSPKAQQMKPEEFFDNSFLQKLDDSGFINSLYAR